MDLYYLLNLVNKIPQYTNMYSLLGNRAPDRRSSCDKKLYA